MRIKFELVILMLLVCTIASAQNVGIGTAAPASKLDVNGGVTIGTTYSGVKSAPTNGAIIQGPVGIGNYAPNASAILDLSNTSNLGFLLPSVTAANESSITPTIAAGGGLMFYNSTNKCIDAYMNGHWEPVYCSCPTITPVIAGGYSTSLCPATSNSFSVPFYSGATSYAWSVTPGTTGATPTSGTGTSFSVNTTASGTYTVTCTVANACSVSFTNSVSVTVNPVPTLTSAGTASVCYSSGSQTASMAYSASSGSPTSYSIVWNSTIPNQASTSYTFLSGGSAMTGINVPAGLAVGSYTGTVTFANANGCTGTQAITLTVNANPTITSTGTATPVCYSTSGQTTVLPYTAETGSPTSFSIVWSNTISAQTSTTCSFVPTGGNMGNITVPASLAANTYTGTVTISNANSCTATQAISMTVNPAISSPTVATSFAYVGNSQANVPYSVTPVTGYTYTWAVSGPSSGSSSASISNGTSSGTSAITGTAVSVTWTGGTLGTSVTYTISVTASGTCPASSPTTIPVQAGGIVSDKTPKTNGSWGGASYYVSQITAQLWGAGGGGGSGSTYSGGSGGAGGYMVGTIGSPLITASSSGTTTLSYVVGGGGQNGAQWGGGAITGGGGLLAGASSQGGTGGGRSAIQISGNTADIMTAGGGGGGGYDNSGGNYPAGGGGGGGAANGAGGTGFGYDGSATTEGGIGGTIAGGGAGGSYSSGNYGGNGGTSTTVNGGTGAGGGYYGGGGGGGYVNSSGIGAGGGGGSGYDSGGGGGGASYPGTGANAEVGFAFVTTGNYASSGTPATVNTYSTSPAPTFVNTTYNYKAGVGAGGKGNSQGTAGNGGPGEVVIMW